jgi:hypothetical protein
MSVVGGYVPRQNTLYPIGSVKTAMDELVALEETVASFYDNLRVYRWQPNVAQLPAIWNWIAPSIFQQRDQARWSDMLAINAFVGIAHSDNETEMARIEDYVDAFRDVVDQEFSKAKGPQLDGSVSPGPLNGTVTEATRQNMVGPNPVEMNGTPVMTFSFGLLLRLDRRISPTGR